MFALIPALRRHKQEGLCKFKVSVVYSPKKTRAIQKPCFKKQKSKTKRVQKM